MTVQNSGSAAHGGVARPVRLGVLVSGRGSNLQAIIDGIGRGALSAEIAIVISNHPDVPAIDRARRHDIPWKVISTRAGAENVDPQAAMAELLERSGVDLVVLAGFDRILGRSVIDRFKGRVINIHPSLLPAFGGGLHAQADALAYGVKVSGCTVHFVTDEVDAGPIIMQAAVQVLDTDTADTLASRVLEQEHEILVQAIRLFAEGRLKVCGRRVYTEPRDEA